MTRVKLALWWLPDLSTSRWQALLEGLPVAKQLHAKRFKSSSRWQSFVAGHHLLQMTQSSIDGAHRTFRSTYGAEWEQPASASSDGLSGGISHSQNLIACVLSDGGDAGVDIETPAARQRNFVELVEHFFSPRERRIFSLVSPQEREQMFLSWWTLKESYLKAQGQGVSSRGLLTEFISSRWGDQIGTSAAWRSCNFFWREGVGAVTIASSIAPEIDFYQMDDLGESLAPMASPAMGEWSCPVEAAQD